MKIHLVRQMKPYLLAIISLTYINVSAAQDDSLLIQKENFNLEYIGIMVKH